MKNSYARLLVLFGVGSISTAAILVLYSDASPLHNAFFRMFFSTLILAPFAIRSFRDLKAINTKLILLMAFSGTALGLHFFTWFISLEHTSIANSMVLICMSPIFTITGGALFFGASFNPKEIMITLVAILGSFIMAFHNGQFIVGEMYGNAMALLGAFLIAVYLLIGRHVRQSITTTLYTFIVYGFATLSLGIIALFSEPNFINHSTKDWVIFMMLAIFPTLLGHSLFSYALKYVKASFISTSILFEPVLTILLAMVLFKEYPDIIQLLGGGLILIAMMFSTLQQET